VTEQATALSPEEVQRILAARAQQLALLPKAEAAEGELLHLATFLLGDERYGVELALMQELQPLDTATWSRIPCPPDFVLGAVNTRGRLHSVTDVCRFLGLPARELSETAHVLLVKGGSPGELPLELCLVADAVPEVTTVPLSALQPAAETVSSQAQEYVRGVTEDMLVVLDLPRLLADPRLIVHETA